MGSGGGGNNCSRAAQSGQLSPSRDAREQMDAGFKAAITTTVVSFIPLQNICRLSQQLGRDRD
jgi:hypothetical protein